MRPEAIDLLTALRCTLSVAAVVVVFALSLAVGGGWGPLLAAAVFAGSVVLVVTIGGAIAVWLAERRWSKRTSVVNGNRRKRDA
jgi:preprotein translocase subunit SecY